MFATSNGSGELLSNITPFQASGPQPIQQSGLSLNSATGTIPFAALLATVSEGVEGNDTPLTPVTDSKTLGVLNTEPQELGIQTETIVHLTNGIAELLAADEITLQILPGHATPAPEIQVTANQSSVFSTSLIPTAAPEELLLSPVRLTRLGGGLDTASGELPSAAPKDIDVPVTAIQVKKLPRTELVVATSRGVTTTEVRSTNQPVATAKKVPFILSNPVKSGNTVVKSIVIAHSLLDRPPTAELPSIRVSAVQDRAQPGFTRLSFDLVSQSEVEVLDSQTRQDLQVNVPQMRSTLSEIGSQTKRSQLEVQSPGKLQPPLAPNEQIDSRAPLTRVLNNTAPTVVADSAAPAVDVISRPADLKPVDLAKSPGRIHIAPPGENKSQTAIQRTELPTGFATNVAKILEKAIPIVREVGASAIPTIATGANGIDVLTETEFYSVSSRLTERAPIVLQHHAAANRVAYSKGTDSFVRPNQYLHSWAEGAGDTDPFQPIQTQVTGDTELLQTARIRSNAPARSSALGWNAMPPNTAESISRPTPTPVDITNLSPKPTPEISVRAHYPSTTVEQVQQGSSQTSRVQPVSYIPAAPLAASPEVVISQPQLPNQAPIGADVDQAPPTWSGSQFSAHSETSRDGAESSEIGMANKTSPQHSDSKDMPQFRLTPDQNYDKAILRTPSARPYAQLVDTAAAPVQATATVAPQSASTLTFTSTNSAIPASISTEIQNVLHENLQALYKQMPASREIIVKLVPEELGMLKIHLHLADDMLSGSIETSRPETAALLQQNQQSLSQRLLDSGVNLLDFQVTHNEGFTSEKHGDGQGDANLTEKNDAKVSELNDELEDLEKMEEPDTNQLIDVTV